MMEYSPLQIEILGALRKYGRNGATRGDIVRDVKSKRTTIYDNLRILEQDGKVKRYKKRRDGRGPPYTMWRLSNLSELIRGEEQE